MILICRWAGGGRTVWNVDTEEEADRIRKNRRIHPDIAKTATWELRPGYYNPIKETLD